MREKIINLLYAENVRSDCGIERLADELCTVDPVKHGKWIYSTNSESVCEEWTCNSCGAFSFEKTNFCPHCGARMDEVTE